MYSEMSVAWVAMRNLEPGKISLHTTVPSQSMPMSHASKSSLGECKAAAFGGYWAVPKISSAVAAAFKHKKRGMMLGPLMQLPLQGDVSLWLSI